MAKTNSDKPSKKRWKCNRCKPSNLPCKHLEKLLPSANSGQFYTNFQTGKRSRLAYTDQVDRMITRTEVPTKDDAGLKKRLEQYNISSLEKDILYYRFMYDYTFDRIAKKLNFIGGPARVYDVYQKTLKKIRGAHGA